MYNTPNNPQQCLLPYHCAGVQWRTWWFNHLLNDHQLLTKWEALQCDTILFFWLISPLLCFCCYAFNCVLMRTLHILQNLIFVWSMTALLNRTLFVLSSLCAAWRLISQWLQQWKIANGVFFEEQLMNHSWFLQQRRLRRRCRSHGTNHGHQKKVNICLLMFHPQTHLVTVPFMLYSSLHAL